MASNRDKAGPSKPHESKSSPKQFPINMDTIDEIMRRKPPPPVVPQAENADAA
jgi:hypothetical protein